MCAMLWGAAQMWPWGSAGFEAGYEAMRRGQRAAGKRCYEAVSPPPPHQCPIACPVPPPPPPPGVVSPRTLLAIVAIFV